MAKSKNDVLKELARIEGAILCMKTDLRTTDFSYGARENAAMRLERAYADLVRAGMALRDDEEDE